MMNKRWKNEKMVIIQAGGLFLTRHSERRYDVRRIAGIQYNVLNLPAKIRFMNGHSIEYRYDASGRKHTAVYKTVRSNVTIPPGTTEMHGLNWYDFEARYYNGITPVFMTPDPMAEKYYSISPYAYCGNNPVNAIDLHGDSITVLNDEVSRNDIGSIVNKNNQDYITYDENGTMTLDFGNMTQKQIDKTLGKDKGLNLLNNLIIATSSDGTSQKFFYATTNERKGIDSRTGDVFNITLNREQGTVTVNDNSFAINLSITPAGDGRVELWPETGYHGTVRISPGTMYDALGVVPRKSLVYHELNENYLRTNKGMSYKDAHKNAGGIGNYTKFIWGK